MLIAEPDFICYNDINLYLTIAWRQEMAQRTIHYLFAEMISRNIELKDKTRFLLGSILPDAYVDVKDRDTTHFMIRGEDGNYFDFHAFLENYYELIQKDDLYLGSLVYLNQISR